MTISGENWSTSLLKRNWCVSLADLYRFPDAPTLAGLERMGRNPPTTSMQPLEASKHRTLDRLITGLTIHHIGTRMAELIAGRVKTLDPVTDDVTRQAQGARGRPDRRGQHSRLFPSSVQPGYSMIWRPWESAPSRSRRQRPGRPSRRRSRPSCRRRSTFTKRSRAEAEALIKERGGKVGCRYRSRRAMFYGRRPGSKRKGQTVGH